MQGKAVHTGLRYEVVRSARRRTAAIRVAPEGVRVMVPQGVSQAWIDAWVKSKAHWIQTRQQQMSEQTEAFQVGLSQGGRLPFMGQELSVHWVTGSAARVTRVGDSLQLQLSSRSQKGVPQQVHALVTGWLKAQAQTELQQRLEHWQQVMGLRSTALKIKGFRRRWGSCDSRGTIALNWRLMMVPVALADYVIVHELAHLCHFNHSPDFWRLVASYLPQYKVLKADLHQRHALLYF